jgi:glutamyl/glutaminyl-tRNA synthetase
MTTPINHSVRTRIAPTPSGFLHLGNVLSFAITAALARKSDAKILLRIDDHDQPRVNKAYLQDIFDTLHFLEIPWDEGPRSVKEFEDGYSQVHRMALYNQALTYLADNNLVFACNCSRSSLNIELCDCQAKQLPLDTENVGWRLITDNGAIICVKLHNDQTTNATLPAEMHNFIIKKKDGNPAYQLTSVIDDLFFGVDFVVRGEDLWSSTLAQHQLALLLGKTTFGDIKFYHHPLIIDLLGNKLSKSAGATSVKYLRENGRTAGDIYMMIAEIMGTTRHVSDWQQLADVLLKF